MRPKQPMVKVLICLIALAMAGSSSHVTAARSAEPSAQLDWNVARVGPQQAGGHIVATEQLLTPAGQQIFLRGRLLDLALSPDRKSLAVKGTLGVTILDAETGAVRQTLAMKPIPELINGAVSLYLARLLGAQGFTGIVWNAAGDEIYCPDAHGELWIAVRNSGGMFEWISPVVLPGAGGTYTSSAASPKTSAPGGVSIDEKRGLIYVTLSRNNAIAVVSRASRKVIGQIAVGNAPYTVVSNEHTAYVSNWGGRRVRRGDKTANSSGTPIVINSKTGIPSTGTVSVIDLASRRATQQIAVGLHPSGMALSADGTRLFVANANSDSISVIDTDRNAVLKTISVRPAPGVPPGSAPDAVAVSPDGSRLFVAMAGLNAIAVVDVFHSKLLGMIPVGWYPSAVQLDPKSSRLYVANLKGIGGRAIDVGLEQSPNPPGYNSHDDAGTVTLAPVPDEQTLSAETLTVARNTRLPEMQAILLEKPKARMVPVPTAPGEISVFKHVIYVIKENRTYDGILGDIGEGNGDPKLVEFGQDISPNHHALARDFILFDNLYCNGTISTEGHMWTDTGITTDYVERSTGNFARNREFYDGSDPMAFSPTGFIWDEVLRKGLSFRNYGEFVAPADGTGSDLRPPWRKDLLEEANRHAPRSKLDLKIALHTIRPYTNPNYAGFDLKIPDAFRMEVFLKDFRGFEKRGNMPTFTLMLLPQDHTAGMSPGYPTPQAQMADNDLALGRLVETVSKSQFWKDTVIFVVEDDSQSGLDHVDGRRTVGFIFSAYTRRHAVDSTFYNQNSILRTMELILGLPPMTQFDLMANPMTAAFQDTPDLTPYTALPNNVPLDEMNKPLAQLHGKAREYAIRSMKPENLVEDGGDEEEKNRITWFAVKGPKVPYPKIKKALN